LANSLTAYILLPYVFVCAMGFRLDPHADTGALTPSADWIKYWLRSAEKAA